MHSVDTYLADITRSIFHLESLAVRTDSQHEAYLVLMLERSRIVNRHATKHTSGSTAYHAHWFCDR